MTQLPDRREDGVAPEELKLSTFCISCGATYPTGTKNPATDRCGAPVNILVCSLYEHHEANESSRSGMVVSGNCPECERFHKGKPIGVLQSSGRTGNCMGKLMVDTPATRTTFG